jgi:hypothetical protein
MWTGPHQAGPGHMSAPDPCLSKASVSFALESLDPTVGSLDPTQRGPEPVPEVRSTCTGVRRFPMWVRTHCWHLGLHLFPWPHGDPGAIHVVESGAVHHVTRDSRVGTVSSCCIKGYP